jgi:iron complex transport system ATP-binding protein
LIKLDQLYFRRNSRDIISNVTLHMNDGEHWVLLGRNGSGKTTLLDFLTGYQFPSSGKVKVMDYTYGNCDVREVRKEIGIISQSLFEKFTLRDPVWEVVATGVYAYLRFYQTIPDEVKDMAVEQLRKVRLEHVKDQTLGSLSQGERKKVMLARALIMNPKILILDEPCSGLDLYEREHFLDQLQQLSTADIQLVYVTHHMEEIIPLFTHVALIEDGKVVAAGEKEKVLTTELIQQTFQVKVDIEWIQDRPWYKVMK